MCYVCERQRGPVVNTLAPFLAEGVRVEFKQVESRHGKWERIILTKGDQVMTLTADGDHGPSYFHWRPERDETGED